MFSNQSGKRPDRKEGLGKYSMYEMPENQKKCDTFKNLKDQYRKKGGAESNLLKDRWS